VRFRPACPPPIRLRTSGSYFRGFLTKRPPTSWRPSPQVRRPDRHLLTKQGWIGSDLIPRA
jgi:hypothetical protein